MKKNINLQESIINIFALGALKEGCERINYNSIFQGFMKIAAKNPELFPGIYFSTSGGEPHSKILEDIISSLGTWQILTVDNPRYQFIKVNKDILATIEDDIREEYGQDILNKYYELAKNFSEEIRKLEN